MIFALVCMDNIARISVESFGMILRLSKGNSVEEEKQGFEEEKFDEKFSHLFFQKVLVE